MSLEKLKISPSEISQYGVVSAPDKLTGGTQENKAVFDKLIKAIVAIKMNELIDALVEMGVENVAEMAATAAKELVETIIPKGGGENQVLAKASDKDGDCKWHTIPVEEFANLAQQAAESAAKDAAAIVNMTVTGANVPADSETSPVIKQVKEDGSVNLHFNVRQGLPGVYVGTGEMPEGYFLQIDPEGDIYNFNDFSEEQKEKLKAVSPTVQVEDIDGGHRITITDVEGVQTFDVLDGTGGGIANETDPTVYDWAKRELFYKENLVDPASRNSFIEIEGIEYYRYHCSAQSFEYYNPAPKPGSVTINYRVVNQYGTGVNTRLIVYYEDGSTANIQTVSGEAGTFTTDASKTFVKLTGNYDMENWALLDMSVMSMLASYDKNVPVETDSTLTQSGKAADAKAVGDAISQLSSQNANCLPEYSEADNGKVLGIVDGSPAWVETTVSGGGSSGDTETTTHGVVWDLVNVTSSNNAVAISDGASLSAVLTPADGYTLGDVTVTVGGEVVTGAWNADTATVTIASVTGDVVISCAGVVVYEETPVTINWVNGTDASGVFTESYASPAYVSHVDLVDATKHDLKLHMPFDSAYCSEESTQKTLMVYVYSDSAQESCLGRYKIDTGEISATATGWDYLTWDTDLIIPSGYYVRIFMNKSGCSSNANLLSYFQNHTVAYLVTPTATAEASAAQAVDDDYAMNYGISTLALVTDESANTKTGIDSAYAAVIEEAKNAWMLAANGDMDKIPLMIHTDQHGHLNSDNPLFSFISEIVNWYDISKVINLGDTVSNWVDSDTEHPLTECAALESYLEAMADVPFSKRIEIFGNHDTWDDSSGTGSYTGLTPQNYLYKYFRNIYARRADNYGNFVVRDDNYNIKYVVVSGFAYDSELGGYTHYVIDPDGIRWIISELEKADGYDVVLLSHCPLGLNNATVYNPADGTSETKTVEGVSYTKLTDLWSGRKAKTSGSVTDEYGTAYSFDFSNCDGELLCGLHGHVHADGYYYLGDLMDAYFDGYLNNNAVSFILIDRANRRLNVWKVDDTPQYQNYQIPLDKPAE